MFWFFVFRFFPLANHMHGRSISLPVFIRALQHVGRSPTLPVLMTKVGALLLVIANFQISGWASYPNGERVLRMTPPSGSLSLEMSSARIGSRCGTFGSSSFIIIMIMTMTGIISIIFMIIIGYCDSLRRRWWPLKSVQEATIDSRCLRNVLAFG